MGLAKAAEHGAYRFPEPDRDHNGVLARANFNAVLRSGMMAPPRPGGSNSQARWFQWAHDSILSLRPQDVPGAIVHRTSRGTISIPRAVKNGGGSPISAYRLKEHQDDYLVVVTWNGTTEGEKLIVIGKPPELQFNVTTETIDGIHIAYGTYNAISQSRVSTSSLG